MRVDTFLIKEEAYMYKYQMFQQPFRRIFTLLTNFGKGEDDKPNQEFDVWGLSMLDSEIKEYIDKTNIPIQLTPEQIRQQKIADGIITE